MDKIIESVLNDLIKRIEILEGKKTETVKPLNASNKSTGDATEKQREFIKQLGGNPPGNLSRKEAGYMIDTLKAKQPKKKDPKTDLEVVQKATEKLAGAFHEKEMESFGKSMKPLTKKEIAELGEGALL